MTYNVWWDIKPYLTFSIIIIIIRYRKLMYIISVCNVIMSLTGVCARYACQGYNIQLEM